MSLPFFRFMTDLEQSDFGYMVYNFYIFINRKTELKTSNIAFILFL